jgi:hypothetical protein
MAIAHLSRERRGLAADLIRLDQEKIVAVGVRFDQLD